MLDKSYQDLGEPERSVFDGRNEDYSVSYERETYDGYHPASVDVSFIIVHSEHGAVTVVVHNHD